MPRLPVLFLVAWFLLRASSLRGAEPPAGPSPITAADLLKINELESPALSPDEKRVVYVVRSIEPKPATKDDWVYHTQLWLAATDGGTPSRPLMTSPADDSGPVWSPQGDRIAFVRREETGRDQIHLITLAGGDDRPLTTLESGAREPRWSPDGRSILFTSSLSRAQMRAALELAKPVAAPVGEKTKPEPKPKNPGAAESKAGDSSQTADHKISATNAGGAGPKTSESPVRKKVAGNPYAASELNFIDENLLEPVAAFSRLYVVEARAGATPEPVTTGYENYAGARWLADGKSLVCIGARLPGDQPDRPPFNHLFLLDRATGIARPLLEEAGSNYGEPTPSPDGKWIAYTQVTGGEFTFDQARVAIIPSAGGTPKILTLQLDRAATNLKWSPDGAAVYFTAADRGSYSLYRVPTDQDHSQNLTTDRTWGIRDFSAGSRTLVQIVTQPGNPWELYHGSTDGKTCQPLTTHNSSWLKDRKLSPLEPHRLENSEGIIVDYWTMKPVNFDAAKKYPLLVEIHGGPAQMWGPGEASAWHELQYFAGRGYAVVFCNPRGSTGYGRNFQRANFRDWAIGPGQDVLYAVNFAAKETYVDSTRQVLTGETYGGYLTAWIIAHDQRFKAAAACDGIYDLPAFYGEGHRWFLVPRYWGGNPWQNNIRLLLDHDSPLPLVEKIQTPLLITSGGANVSTGRLQSQLLYLSLKQLGREVESADFPAAGTGPDHGAGPKQRLDRLARLDAFFRHFIGEN